jgi:nucleoredoxin
MSALEALLGAVVVNGNRQPVSVSSLIKEGKVIGLYFSAHWCPPCRGFTPALANFYNHMKQTRGDVFEVVFVSSDQDESQWSQYFSEMPWLALPFADRSRKQAISNQYGVTGIPTLVLLDARSGGCISQNARMNVVQDPSGSGFPWA